MKLIKHKRNKDVAYKVDYMVSLGSVCHFYGGWVNLTFSVPRIIDTEKLSIPLSELDDWVEKEIDYKQYQKGIEWKEMK